MDAAQLDRPYIVLRRDGLKRLRHEERMRKTFMEHAADSVTLAFGSVWFLVINLAWFAIWMLVNIGLHPGMKPFDPFPFGLLTMIVSLEAIILSIFVLISQNREQKIADLREELDLQTDVITQAGVIKILEILRRVADKQGIDLSHDEDLRHMINELGVKHHNPHSKSP